jgi:CelD/BcsL family acetyltransferase involved in cellulose biosynthesis
VALEIVGGKDSGGGRPSPAARAEPPAGTQAGRGRRRHDSTRLSVETHRTTAGLRALRPAWDLLYESSGSRNPYAAPDWVVTWLRHFAAEGEIEVLAVSRDGRLVGVAPCYLRRIGRWARTVQLAGTGRHDALTELPGVLSAPEESRSVLRAVVRHWCERYREWDWLELPMDARQGWFEPEWLTGAPAGHAVIRHKTTRPSVVLPLPRDPGELRSSLKRNVRESVRRGRNRLERTGRPWTITAHSSAGQVGEAWPALARLHAARAGIAGPRRHPDALGVPGRAGFLAEVLPLLAAHGRAEILTLDVDGVPVAAQGVLLAPRASYLAFSGVDPQWWDVSPVTLLQLAAGERAIGRGHGELNLSLGPDVAKLRWSELVVQHPEFVLCGPRRRSRLAYTGYALAAEGAGIRREAARHRAGTGAAEAHGRGADDGAAATAAVPTAASSAASAAASSAASAAASSAASAHGSASPVAAVRA